MIADRVLAVRSAVFTVNSDQQERPLDILPRPKTALERVRERHIISELLEVERQLFGGGIQVDS